METGEGAFSEKKLLSSYMKFYVLFVALLLCKQCIIETRRQSWTDTENIVLGNKSRSSLEK